MSRIAKAPVSVPKGVRVAVDSGELVVEGPRGSARRSLPPGVEVSVEGEQAQVRAAGGANPGWAMIATHRALLANMVTGVSSGYTKRLQLVGVGYRAQKQGATLHLNLGHSHPIEMPVPEGISIEVPSQTEIVVSGVDKQKVGQVSAVIRGYRPPEPYKGKGVKYSDEVIERKEAKKK